MTHKKLTYLILFSLFFINLSLRSQEDSTLINYIVPDTYLDATYITNHINKFNQEGGAFIIRKSDIISNPEHVTIAPRKFIGSKSEMEGVLSKYNAAEKNPQVLIDDLDLGNNYFSRPNDEVYFVIVEPNKGFHFDMPTGNEIGAYDTYGVSCSYKKNEI